MTQPGGSFPSTHFDKQRYQGEKSAGKGRDEEYGFGGRDRRFARIAHVVDDDSAVVQGSRKCKAAQTQADDDQRRRQAVGALGRLGRIINYNNIRIIHDNVSLMTVLN